MGKSRKINSDRFITIPHPIIRLNIEVILRKYPESTLVFPWKLRNNKYSISNPLLFKYHN